MIGLLANVVWGGFPDLLSVLSGGGAFGLDGSSDDDGSIGFSGGVGLDYYAGDGPSVGLNGGLGLFA